MGLLSNRVSVGIRITNHVVLFLNFCICLDYQIGTHQPTKKVYTIFFLNKKKYILLGGCLVAVLQNGFLIS